MLKQLSVAVAAALLASCAVPTSQDKTADSAEDQYQTSASDAPIHDKAATAEQVANALFKHNLLLKPDAKLARYDNLWQRIADQMSLDIPEHKDIETQKRFFLRNQKLLKIASDNAEPFLYHIVTELERRKMPLELALLPIVESTYNPKAGSFSSVLGIWQFSAGTGRNFGLKQNAWYDGRRDVIESSRAAMDYLQYLYSNVDQDWLSAVAAFNAGEGRVFRAIKRNRNSGKPVDFWSLNLPKETTSYIPKLLALAELLKNAEKYAIPMPLMANKAQTKIIQINRGLDLAKAAEVLNLSVAELRRLNPGFKTTTVPSSSYQLVVPFRSADDIEQQLAALPKVKVAPIASTGRYKVKSGDSLSKIAATHKTSVKALQRANNLSSSQLKIGQMLTIPGLAQPDEPDVSARSAKKSGTSASGVETYTVKSGDSLWEIGKKLNVSTEQLSNWNKLGTKAQLKPGQKLAYYTESKPQTTAAAKSMTYKVRPGDSLASIAQRFKVKVADILKWNNIKTNKYLQPGQELTLYLTS
ncbi:MAG: LysM peptidoglycan-binding domain-containing protein [Gammaproteobacteria bacterium]|nr:LysM peptidoglycan-binding domain-containing protein [Gammaproteobacteria bacterium]MBU2056730.1 LysM peptidoglycan-binding domain-containing protein [Gammaproteobacteria bacterium]MBU2174067.1 LysM peptidoglycan-binding domain-containing protein [Gammaproteobacteria bacterium]MBU2247373.1 LysM peptidoglycan-binding domain-containing protein [Gammaproteobacteria bacterium]MBU2345238.1 LysM peptidoglycan-binding domain-containing protein [Gammaproteobacteria bacterium]